MKLWIDTDAGVDDSSAILLCLHCQDVEVVGISCVGGNASLPNVINNVNRTLKVYGSTNIPIYAGAYRALIQPAMVIPEIHGHDGLGDINDAEFGITGENKLEKEHAVNAIIRAANEIEDLCVLCLGPLTNLALAFRMDEKAMLKIKHFYIMGGAEDGSGNTSPYAEFNFRCDPEAAQIVLQTYPQSKTTLISWTLTCTHKIDPAEKLTAFTDTKLGLWVNRTWDVIVKFLKGIMLMADPLAAFVCCYHDKCIKKADRLHLEIVLSGDHVGESVPTPDENGVEVIKEVDFDMYMDTFKAMMSSK